MIDLYIFEAYNIYIFLFHIFQALVDISGKREQHVVKCISCGEATPIRNAPPGRKYVRCPCNCLLICKNTSVRIACPRQNCRRVISLAPSGPPQAPVPNVPGMCRVVCAHCHDNFLVSRWFFKKIAKIIPIKRVRCPPPFKYTKTMNKKNTIYFMACRFN